MTQNYEFFTQLARILNSGQARSVILSGNIHDLFWDGKKYVPLIPYLLEKTRVDGLIQIVYELNGPLRIQEADRVALRDAWATWKSGVDLPTLALRDLQRQQPEVDLLRAEFDQHLRDATGNATLALELLRQLTICSRTALKSHLLLFVEAADLMIPAASGSALDLNDRQLRRVSIMQDWFVDPAFVEGRDSVVLLTESRSQINARVSRLPQVLETTIPSPPTGERKAYIDRFLSHSDPPLKLWSSPQELADFCAGLSLHAVRQLLVGAAYAGETLQPEGVVAKVESFIQSQLGDDVVEFKKPGHTLDEVVGFAQLKKFLREELIPRFKARDEKGLTGAAVAGPIGCGKTFVFEAVAAELDIPVLVLKSIRSQWFGQTDVIFERLRRVLDALEKVVIFVDEADTQFGQVGANAHETERRLTGKIQAMMSDARLRGRVLWLLMTARIHLLSPDIRRPGRVGDLIIPVLDPQGADRREFIAWMLKKVELADDAPQGDPREQLIAEFSAAAFASLRSQILAMGPKSVTDVLAIVKDQLPPSIGKTRRYQTLHAMLNCTRRSLLPDPNVTEETRAQWEQELRALEHEGVS